MLNWNEIVSNYIIKHSNQIKKVTQPLRDHFNINYFTYHRIDNAGKYTVLVDRPDWANHYVNEKIYLDDPYLRNPKVYQTGLCLIESHGSKEYQSNILKSGKKVLNMDLGVLLIQKTHHHVEFFGFTANKESSSLEKIYMNKPQLLSSFAIHFKNELKAILNNMEKESNYLLDLKGKDYLCPETISPSIPSSSQKAYLNDLGMKKEIELTEKLSQRERECLKLLLINKSSKETASILGLSSRTVESYFENIKNKLSCCTKKELFSLAKELDFWDLL